VHAGVIVEGPDQPCCLLSSRGRYFPLVPNGGGRRLVFLLREQEFPRITFGPTCSRAGLAQPMLRSVRRGWSRINGRGVDEGRGWVGVVKYWVGAAQQGDEADEGRLELERDMEGGIRHGVMQAMNRSRSSRPSQLIPGVVRTAVGREVTTGVR
jgi:hypothetical protein